MTWSATPVWTGTGQNTVGTNTVSVSTGSITCSAGTTIIAGVVCDNTGASTPTVTSLSKKSGETATWQLLGSYTANPTTSGGATVGYLYGITTTSTWTGEGISAVLSESVTAKTIAAHAYTGGSVTVRSGTAMSNQGDNVTTSTASHGNGDLMVCLVGQEANTAPTMSPASGLTYNSSSVATSGGGSAANAGIALYTLRTDADRYDGATTTTISDGGVIWVGLRPALTSVTSTVNSSWNVRAAVFIRSVGAYAEGTAVSSRAVPYPSSITSTDALFCLVALGTTTATLSTVTGWTKVYEFVAGSSTGQKMGLYRKNTVTGSETGTVTFGWTGDTSNVLAYMTSYGFEDTTKSWDIIYDHANDSTASDPQTGNSQTTMDIEAGDLVAAYTSVEAFSGLFTSVELTTPGVTYGAANLTNFLNTEGTRNAVSQHFATSGTATGVTTWTSDYNIQSTVGGAVLVRMRAVSGLTSVSQTAAAAWHVKAPLASAATKASAWNVLSSLTPVTQTKASEWRVLAPLAASATVTSAWHVKAPLAAAATKAAAWHVKAPLAAAATKAAAWKINAQIQQTALRAWHVKAPLAAAATKAAAWKVNAQVEQTKAASWHVKAPLATPATKDAAWAIDAQIQQTQQAAWHVKAPLAAAATKAAAWHVKAPLTAPATKDAAWRVLQAVPQSVNSEWRVTQQVFQTADSAWRVVSSIEATAQSAWDILLAVEQTQTAAWDVLTIIEETKPVAWHVLTAISREVDAAWNVAAQVEQSIASTWHVLASVEQTIQTAWAVEASASVTQTADSAWRVLATAEQTQTSSWNVATAVVPVTQTADSAWRVLATVEQSISSAWRIDELVPVTQTADSAWAVAAQITQTVDSAWAIDAQVEQVAQSAWAIDATLTQTADSAWGIDATISQTAPAAWHVLAIVEQSTASAWDVLTTVEEAAQTSAWDVLTTTAAATASSAWNVLTSIEQSQSSAWRVLASTEQTALAAWRVLALVSQPADSAWKINAQISQTADTAWSIVGVITQTQSSAWNIDGTLLATPTGLMAIAVSRTQINLSWNAVNGATGYDVERDDQIITTTPDISYPDSGLAEGSTHTYRVRAVKVV